MLLYGSLVGVAQHLSIRSIRLAGIYNKEASVQTLFPTGGYNNEYVNNSCQQFKTTLMLLRVTSVECYISGEHIAQRMQRHASPNPKIALKTYALNH